LLVERRLILDQRGRPLERTESRYVGDRYPLDVIFEVERRPSGGSEPGDESPSSDDGSDAGAQRHSTPGGSRR
jgi:hypothetical protein